MGGCECSSDSGYALGQVLTSGGSINGCASFFHPASLINKPALQMHGRFGGLAGAFIAFILFIAGASSASAFFIAFTQAAANEPRHSFNGKCSVASRSFGHNAAVPLGRLTQSPATATRTNQPCHRPSWPSSTSWPDKRHLTCRIFCTSAGQGHLFLLAAKARTSLVFVSPKTGHFIPWTGIQQSLSLGGACWNLDAARILPIQGFSSVSFCIPDTPVLEHVCASLQEHVIVIVHVIS